VIFDWRAFVSSLAVYASLLCLSTTAFAQPSPKAQPDIPQAAISERELTAFVKAYVETQRIRQEYEPALVKSNDAEKNRLIENKANDELKKSLAKQNLTVEQYNRIYNQVNSDERLREKTLKLVEEERKSTRN
jgi:hypothetical protein